MQQRFSPKCCLGFSEPMFASRSVVFYFVYWEKNKTVKQFGYARERAEGRIGACNPLNLEHHTFNVSLYWKGSLIQSYLCFWLLLFPYILTKPFCPIWLGLFASDTSSAYRLMALISESGRTFKHQSMSMLSLCSQASIFCSDSSETHANVTKN